MQARIEACEDLCAELGDEPARAGLAWLLHRSAVTAAILGPRAMAQPNGAIQADIKVDEKALVRLDTIFASSGRPAPRLAPGEGYFFGPSE